MRDDQTAVVWLGHSCFAVEKNGYRIILDPYADHTVSGYEPLRIDACQVLCSHEHADHAGRDCVRITEKKMKTSSPGSQEPAGNDGCPFSVTEIHSWHDDCRGRKRGSNIIRILTDGTYRIAHMGDIGCMPDEEQIKMLMDLDVCLVPVGGFFTMAPAKVFELMTRIKPKTVIPMHFRFKQNGKSYGMRIIAPVSQYLKNCTNVVTYNRNYLLLPDDLKEQTAVLRLN